MTETHDFGTRAFSLASNLLAFYLTKAFVAAKSVYECTYLIKATPTPTTVTDTAYKNECKEFYNYIPQTLNISLLLMCLI